MAGGFTATAAFFLGLAFVAIVVLRLLTKRVFQHPTRSIKDVLRPHSRLSAHRLRDDHSTCRDHRQQRLRGRGSHAGFRFARTREPSTFTHHSVPSDAVSSVAPLVTS